MLRQRPSAYYLLCAIGLIERGAASIATTTLVFKDADKSRRAKIGFVKYKDNELVADWEADTWKAMHYGVKPFGKCSRAFFERKY